MVRFGLISAAALMSGAITAQAATVDFTDSSVWASGSSTYVIDGVTISLSSTGGAIRQTASEGPSDAGTLSGATDGLGIGDDEISFPGQSITVHFSEAVKVTGLRFLDLFLGPQGLDYEVAIAGFSDGSSVETAANSETGSGYVFNSGFTPVTTTMVTFTSGFGNDEAGLPDFALAGLDFEIQVVPLPASVLLMGAGLMALGAVGRRRRSV